MKRGKKKNSKEKPKISKVKGKKVVVISLGGSIIIPNNIDTRVLKDFKKVIKSQTKKYKFVIVCGGGSIARKYIYSLRETGASEDMQSFAGIAATRTNARFMSYFFGQNPKQGIPHTMKEVKEYLRKEEIVFCGALEYKANQTSDATAAEIAKEFESSFINISNVPGLYDKNPLEHKNAKPILHISWKEFQKMASKQKYQPGQHFILDQKAAKMIMQNKTQTFLVGKDMKQLNNLLRQKPFKGSVISG